MIDLVKRFFNKGREEGLSVREAGTSHDIRVATCALFLEMSHIDGEFSESEREYIMSILKKDYGLSGEYTAALLEAAHEELKGSIDLWQFTNLINQNYSVAEKLQIIETIWRIAYTDGKLDKHEDYLLHKLAKLLRLTHKQLIEAKLKAKKPLSDH
ncbi:MAG: TerB family tellurite resistance protein [Desulfobacterales bacterium]|nr:MAG: TerB family tellurite resistance protein [Desulfobacterales bacterium]